MTRRNILNFKTKTLMALKCDVSRKLGTIWCDAKVDLEEMGTEASEYMLKFKESQQLCVPDDDED